MVINDELNSLLAVPYSLYAEVMSLAIDVINTSLILAPLIITAGNRQPAFSIASLVARRPVFDPNYDDADSMGRFSRMN